MRSRLRSTLVRHPAAVALCFLAATPLTRAEERSWNTGLDGVFGDAANWDDGAMGIPGLDDTAVFDVAAVFSVNFLVDRITDRILARRGLVTFSLGGEAIYDLLCLSPLAPSIVVGDEEGDLATLILSGGPLRGVYTDIGRSPGSYGALILDGSGARLENDQQLRVGIRGTGFVEFTGGATAVNRRAVLGQLAGGYGEAMVAGAGSRWTCDELLSIGDRGAGALLIADGASVSSIDAIVAQNLGSFGSVTLAGAGSGWEIDGFLDVGMNGIGLIEVASGAVLMNRDIATIGTFPPESGEPPGSAGVGTVSLHGPSTAWHLDGGFFVGDLHVGLASLGTLEVGGGAIVRLDGDLYLNDHGAIPGMPVLIVTLSSSGDYRAASAPAIAAGGGVYSNIADPLVQVELAPGFEPEAGDTFHLIMTTSGADIVQVALPPLPTSLAWGVTQRPDLLAADVVPAFCAVDPGAPGDCNANGIVDECELFYEVADDCNGNGVPDWCDLTDPAVPDCNDNGVPDECDITSGASADCDGSGVPDECEALRGSRKLIAVDGEEEAEFGAALDADGDGDDSLLAIGAPGDDGTGSVYLYRRSGATWVPGWKLRVSDGVDGDRFGTAVAIQGEVLVVGADEREDGVGAAYVFRRMGDRWYEETKLLATEITSSMEFGHSVALDGEVIFVGARETSDVPHRDGLAFGYRFDGATWVVDAELALTGGLSGFFREGASVTLEGSVVVVGASAGGAGEVAVFGYDGSTWTPTTTFEPNPFHGSAKYGGYYRVPMALSDDTLAIGGSGDDAGTVFIFRRDGTIWREDTTVQPLGAPVESFGSAVALAGDVLIVGAGEDDAAEPGPGAIYVFDRTGDTWTQREKLTIGLDAAEHAFLGRSLALAGERILSGALGDGEHGPESGAVHQFDLRAIDCNANGAPDHCDIAAGTSFDRNGNTVPDECETCPADVDGSGDVEFTDLLAVLSAWGPCPGCPADVNFDGTIDFADLLLVLTWWGDCP